MAQLSWSKEDIAPLQKLRAKKVGRREIAEQPKRALNAVESKAEAWSPAGK